MIGAVLRDPAPIGMAAVLGTSCNAAIDEVQHDHSSLQQSSGFQALASVGWPRNRRVRHVEPLGLRQIVQRFAVGSR